jgi:5-methyltetrahydrofolate--homocysteine methyltransferase
MSDVEEAIQAIMAVKENTGLEVTASFTFEASAKGEFRTMMGVSPAKAAEEAVAAGADIVGANCGRGYEGLDKVIAEIKETVPAIPIIIQANAGIPKNVKGVDVFPATPDEMAEQVSLWIESGSSIIGGCCGTMPEHIRAIRDAVDSYEKTHS